MKRATEIITADFENISAKKVRKQIERDFKISFQNQRIQFEQFVSEIYGKYLEKINEAKASHEQASSKDATTDIPVVTANKTGAIIRPNNPGSLNNMNRKDTQERNITALDSHETAQSQFSITHNHNTTSTSVNPLDSYFQPIVQSQKTAQGAKPILKKNRPTPSIARTTTMPDRKPSIEAASRIHDTDELIPVKKTASSAFVSKFKVEKRKESKTKQPQKIVIDSDDGASASKPKKKLKIEVSEDSDRSVSKYKQKNTNKTRASQRLKKFSNTEQLASKLAKLTEKKKVPSPKTKHKSKVPSRKSNQPVWELAPALQNIIHCNSISKPDVIKKLWDYVLKNHLKDPSNDRMIINDEKMKAAFRTEKMTMFEMNTVSCSIYRKF